MNHTTSRHLSKAKTLDLVAPLTGTGSWVDDFRYMPAPSKIPFANRNQTGWWIFKEVQQWVSNRQKTLRATSRCLVWENTRLIRAKNRNEAYKKALTLGKEGHPSKTKDGEWRFAGISMLLPIYDVLEDGAEIMWVDHGLMPVHRIKKLTKTKRDLPIFNDRKVA